MPLIGLLSPTATLAAEEGWFALMGPRIYYLLSIEPRSLADVLVGFYVTLKSDLFFTTFSYSDTKGSESTAYFAGGPAKY